MGIANKALNFYGNFQGQPPSFNAMLFQNMLMLYPYASGALQPTGGTGQAAQLRDQGAMTQLYGLERSRLRQANLSVGRAHALKR